MPPRPDFSYALTPSMMTPTVASLGTQGKVSIPGRPVSVPRLDLGASSQRPSGIAPSFPSRSLPQLRTREGDKRSPCLCVELVVPADNECSLLLPRIHAQSFRTSGSVTIDDCRGAAVFVATFAVGTSSQPAACEGRRLILRSAVDDIVFAFARDTETNAGGKLPGLSIFHASEKAFGILRPDSHDQRCGYSIQTTKGVCLYFRGDLQTGSMNITDENGRLLAMTEATGAHKRSVRIGPRVDAGLVTLAMLGIDLLEYDRSTQGTPVTANSPR